MSYVYNTFSKIGDFFLINLPRFIRNIYRFRKALWNHRWWDYSGTLHFIEIGLDDMSNNIKTKGVEIHHSRLKKVAMMKRASEILKNIREYRYFDIVEAEMGRAPVKGNFEFVPYKAKFGCFELADNRPEEEKAFRAKYYARIDKLEEQEWRELWEIIKGQDYDSFDKHKDFDDQFDGSGIKGWEWD